MSVAQETIYRATLATLVSYAAFFYIYHYLTNYIFKLLYALFEILGCICDTTGKYMRNIFHYTTQKVDTFIASNMS